jgi:hypothetical protein
MPDDAKRKAARKSVRAAQKQFEPESSATNKLRRKAFAQAQKEGLSLREIHSETAAEDRKPAISGTSRMGTAGFEPATSRV